jgi:hypothetical protein
MNDLELVNQFRAEVPEPGPQALCAVEARLRDPSGRTRRPAWSRPLVTRLALAGALTVAVSVGALTLHGSTDPAPRSPAMRPASAAELLDQAALAAERTPELQPRPDQFFVYESVTMDAEYTKDGPFLVRAKVTAWRSVDQTRSGAVRSEHLAPWAYPGTPLPPAAADDVGRVESFSSPVCVTRPPDNARTDYAYVSHLPTDPAQMLRVLTERRSGDPSQDRRAWTAVGDLLRESYLPPAQRAALFRAAKLIPNVSLAQNVVDAADRSGIAVAWTDEERGTREELIFNPTTLLYQGERSVIADPTTAAGAMPVPVSTRSAAPTSTPTIPGVAPAGTELSNSAELSVTVVDKAPAFPPPGRSCR